MENLHILPTNKPSRLYKEDSVYKLDNLVYGTGNQNIYITSDEEIKVGDWTLMFDGLGNLFLCDKPQQYLGIEKGHHLNKGLRKIILTTDQDLIKDGVQAIDDEFLEWFVNNPSCERVEVKEKQHFEADKSKRKNPLNGVYYSYKIIIPKEELKTSEEWQKQFTNTKVIDPDGWDRKNYHYSWFEEKITLIEYTSRLHRSTVKGIIPTEEPKQETLEEAAKNYAVDVNVKMKGHKNTYENCSRIDFIAGVKWQAERMYSEEEVKEIIKLSCEEGMLIQRTINNKVKIPYMRIKDFTIKIFEQFKKK